MHAVIGITCSGKLINENLEDTLDLTIRKVIKR